MPLRFVPLTIREYVKGFRKLFAFANNHYGGNGPGTVGDGSTIGWVTVEIHEEPTVQRMQVGKMLGWINSSGKTPRDELRKQKLRTLLKDEK